MSRIATRIFKTIEEYVEKKNFVPAESQKAEFRKMINSLRERYFYDDEYGADFRNTIKFIKKYLDDYDLIGLLLKFQNFELILHPIPEDDYYPIYSFIDPIVKAYKSSIPEVYSSAYNALIKIIYFLLDLLDGLQYIDTIASIVYFYIHLQKGGINEIFDLFKKIVGEERRILFSIGIHKFLSKLPRYKEQYQIESIKSFCKELLNKCFNMDLVEGIQFR